jgi:hypothetical protein
MITTFIANKNSERKHWDLGAISVFFEVKFLDLTKIIIIIIKGEKTHFFIILKEFFINFRNN